jgi:hypothetical protein
MVEKETSGAPQSNSPTPEATGAAPGGSSFLGAMPPTDLAAPTECYYLRLLVAAIKQANQEPTDKGPNQGG